MRPKLSYQNWDTFHMGLMFFIYILPAKILGNGVRLHPGPGRACQVGGIGRVH